MDEYGLFEWFLPVEKGVGFANDVRFVNDAALLMLWGKHLAIAAQSDANIIFAEQMYHIASAIYHERNPASR